MLLSKCSNFIQVSDCWSDSIMWNKRSVVRSPKCSAMKLEAVKQPEVVCRFPIGSGVSLPYLKWCVASLPEVVCRFPTGSGVSLPYRKWCVASAAVVFQTAV